jgi:hypothetical protein
MVGLAPVKKAKGERVFGTGKGDFWVSDDFDAPLPDEILKLFGN